MPTQPIPEPGAPLNAWRAPFNHSNTMLRILTPIKRQIWQASEALETMELPYAQELLRDACTVIERDLKAHKKVVRACAKIAQAEKLNPEAGK